MSIVKKANTRGLSLVEILVAMTAFAIIFTGLASTFQALMIANRVTIDLSDCLHHYKDGMRLLLEGDTAYPGLLQAENIATTTVSYDYKIWPDIPYTRDINALRYWVDNASYTVWAANGMLLRARDPDNVSGIRCLMGEPSPVLPDLPKKRIMVATFTIDFAPDEYASGTKSLVRLGIFLHGETDFSNDPTLEDEPEKRMDVNEARLIMHPTIFLRNAELEL